MSGNKFIPWGKKQEDAIFNDRRFMLLAWGTQAGKTTVGALRMKLKMLEFQGEGNHFIITAPTYKVLMQSTLVEFRNVMRGCGYYNKLDQTFDLHTGGRCFFRTETDPDAIVGIKNVRHIWGDEAGLYRKYFWLNMLARADSIGGGIDLTTSPYSLNWVYQDIIKPHKQGVLSDDWRVIQAASWENPYHFLHNPEERAKRKASMDARRFNMIYGGEFGRMEGLVYDCWEDDINFVEPSKLPPGTRFFGGLDWGYHPDPWALKIRAVTPSGAQFGVTEYLKTKDTITDIKRTCAELRKVWPVELFIADPSQPGYIEEMNRDGLPTIKADNDIRLGVDRHYELIKTGMYREFKGYCPHSSDEREQYHYPEPKELRPDEDKKQIVPVDQYNHLMDCDRYLTNYIWNLTLNKKPSVPSEKNKIRTTLDIITKRDRMVHTETWRHDHDQ